MTRMLSVTEGGRVVQCDDSWLGGPSDALLETMHLSQPLGEDTQLSV